MFLDPSFRKNDHLNLKRKDFLELDILIELTYSASAKKILGDAGLWAALPSPVLSLPSRPEDPAMNQAPVKVLVAA